MTSNPYAPEAMREDGRMSIKKPGVIIKSLSALAGRTPLAPYQTLNRDKEIRTWADLMETGLDKTGIGGAQIKSAIGNS